jgi:hypothetical protein
MKQVVHEIVIRLVLVGHNKPFRSQDVVQEHYYGIKLAMGTVACRNVGSVLPFLGGITETTTQRPCAKGIILQ